MTSEERSYLKNKIGELALYCKSRNIPSAFIFAENREGTKKPETVYDKTIITPLQCNVKLHKDHITPLLVVGQGFTMVPTQFTDGFYNFDNDTDKIFTQEPEADPFAELKPEPKPEPKPAPKAKPEKKAAAPAKGSSKKKTK